MMEITVMMETKVRFGFRYRRARNGLNSMTGELTSGNGSPLSSIG
jgi:hypothetical protein